MVAAALKFSSSHDAEVSIYPSGDAGRLEVLNALNWHEAHGEYEWPDFTGFDFAQAMRFRRALVNDVFGALEKAGRVKIAGEQAPVGLATPQNSGKRAGENG